MKMRLVLCFALTLALVAGMAQAAILTHSGSNDPTTEGWTLGEGGSGGTQAPGNELGTDYWGLSEDGTGFYYAQYGGSLTWAQTTDAYTISANVRVVEHNGPVTNVQIALFDEGETYLNVTLLEDLWQVQDSNNAWVTLESSVDLQSGYNLFQIAMTPTTPGAALGTDSYSFFRNGNLIATYTRSQLRPGGPGFNALSWGDPSDSNYTSESHWGDVTFEAGAIPEPATLGVLAIGALMILVRRRK